MRLKRKHNNKVRNMDALIKDLSPRFNIHDVVLRTIIQRGYTSEEEIRDFLNPNINQLHSPFLFKDMRIAVDRINEAIRNQEQIVIWGDYDVDGVSSSSALYLALKQLGGNSIVYIPDRKLEGYGLSERGYRNITSKIKPSLVITVDCGISSLETKENPDGSTCQIDVIELMKEDGVDVIVTDHHEVPEHIPDALAIINPKHPEEQYPFEELAGVGVVFKLIHALTDLQFAMQFIDLIALGTVADVMPLIEENRVIVNEGLRMMNSGNNRPGVQALIDVAFPNPRYRPSAIEASHIGFNIGPMINAQGRLAHSNKSVVLMTTDNPERAKQLANELNEINGRRKEIEASITNQCVHSVEMRELDNIIIIVGEGWEKGVLGIVASRIARRYNRPTIIFNYDPVENEYTGSARSIEGISIYDILNEASFFIKSWGGHDMAAGISVSRDSFELFKEFTVMTANALDDDLFEPIAYYDEEISLTQVNDVLFQSIKALEPCGTGNPKMTFLTKDVIMENVSTFGKEQNHIRFKMTNHGASMPAISWQTNMPKRFHDVVLTYDFQFSNYSSRYEVVVKELLFNEQVLSELKENEKQTRYPLHLIDPSKEKQSQYKNKGIHDSIDLLEYLPRRYVDYSNPVTVNDLRMGSMPEYISICGTINGKTVTRGGLAMAFCTDDMGVEFNVAWFGRAFIVDQLVVGQRYIFCGKYKMNGQGNVQIYPELWSRNIEEYKALVPTYRKITGMADNRLLDGINRALSLLENKDIHDEETLNTFGLISTYDMYYGLHKPRNFNHFQKAKKRNLFDKLFRFNFNLKLRQEKKPESNKFIIKDHKAMEEIENTLPYSLTNDQRKSVLGILEEMKREDFPVQALVQGDVGSGKTIIAHLLAGVVYDNGHQSVMLAPTETLAQQLYQGAVDVLEPFGMNIELLTGSTHGNTKKRILRELKEGSIDMVVGTHAVIQKNVEFKDLALVIVDEQHRFGVAQREVLLNREPRPHYITMSATPIPRTLSMAMFGDLLKVFNIKEKPAGRKEIISKIMEDDQEINEFMRSEINKGHQCYVVVPLVEKSSSEKMVHVKSLKEEVKSLESYFKNDPNIRIGSINGKMKTKDIEEVLGRFKDGEIDILVSTTIVEVGINVPNATVMVLKSSERFGLAQAHQLRGRVGRGDAQSYFIMQATGKDKRAQIMMDSSDGFEIARADLEMRGTGDFLGTEQYGDNDEVLLMLKYDDLYQSIDNFNTMIFKDKDKVDMYLDLLDIEV